MKKYQDTTEGDISRRIWLQNIGGQLVGAQSIGHPLQSPDSHTSRFYAKRNKNETAILFQFETRDEKVATRHSIYKWK